MDRSGVARAEHPVPGTEVRAVGNVCPACASRGGPVRPTITAVRPFRIEVPEADLVDLRERLARTRWPEPATVGGWTQGVPLDYARDLCEHWRRRYDWRRCEAELNALPQFCTTLDGGGDDGVDVHFLHVRSRHEGALPLLLTHGWPGSVVEFLDVVGALTDPPDPADAFHLVIPSLPGYGFSSKPAVAGWGVERIAVAWAQLMDRLDYDRYGAQGGDWGSVVTAALGSAIPEALVGIHLTMPLALRPDRDDRPLSAFDKAALSDRKAFRKVGLGYAAEQATRPQTLGYGLVDSPAALCTWIVEKFWDWSECAGDPSNAVRRDRLLDDVMLYWLPATGASSIRLYWESYRRRRVDPVEVPTGVTQFPAEPQRVPRPWVEERFTDLRYWSEPKVGGHFASLEQPETFVDEVRAFFRLVRPATARLDDPRRRRDSGGRASPDGRR
jgi:pimeloyl-ACP methyl ester carboxylesterase